MIDVAESSMSKEDIRKANLSVRRAEILIKANELADMFYNAVINSRDFKASLVVELKPKEMNLYGFDCRIEK